MDNGLDMLLNQLMPKLIDRVKVLEEKVSALEADKAGVQMFLNQLAPKLVEKIKNLEARYELAHGPKGDMPDLSGIEERLAALEAGVKPKGKRGRPRKTEPMPEETPAPVQITDTPTGISPVQITDTPSPPSGFSIEDIKALANEGKSVEQDVQLWFFNGEKKTAREFGFADILDLPLKERLAAFKERGFVAHDGSIPSPAYGG